MSQNVIENILCFFYRKLRISIGNIEFLSDWPLKILYFHRTTMPDTRRCHRMSLRITYGFLSEISNFYRGLWISIGNGLNFYRIINNGWKWHHFYRGTPCIDCATYQYPKTYKTIFYRIEFLSELSEIFGKISTVDRSFFFEKKTLSVEHGLPL